jgi:hypothetical protein
MTKHICDQCAATIPNPTAPYQIRGVNLTGKTEFQIVEFCGKECYLDFIKKTLLREYSFIARDTGGGFGPSDDSPTPS